MVINPILSHFQKLSYHHTYAILVSGVCNFFKCFKWINMSINNTFSCLLCSSEDVWIGAAVSEIRKRPARITSVPISFHIGHVRSHPPTPHFACCGTAAPITLSLPSLQDGNVSRESHLVARNQISIGQVPLRSRTPETHAKLKIVPKNVLNSVTCWLECFNLACFCDIPVPKLEKNIVTLHFLSFTPLSSSLYLNSSLSEFLLIR